MPHGGDGDDFLFADENNYYAGQGEATTGGNDSLYGDAGSDWEYGGGGDDYFNLEDSGWQCRLRDLATN